MLSKEQQADTIGSLLTGEKSGRFDYYYKQVVFNTGIRYYLFGITPTIEEEIDRAKDQLETQKGLSQMKKWKEN